MNIEFVRLAQVPTADLISLMTHPRLRKHMPLLGLDFDETACLRFVRQKEEAWRVHGYGVWAFYIDGRFVGWGGLQDENGDPDLALVLHPEHWGKGKVLYGEIVRRAFGEMGFDHITALLPLSRRNPSVLERLGFQKDGQVEIGGQPFSRLKLARARYESRRGEPRSAP
jgi:RimJ/RimL family protein N-acetyltransferase